MTQSHDLRWLTKWLKMKWADTNVTYKSKELGVILDMFIAFNKFVSRCVTSKHRCDDETHKCRVLRYLSHHLEVTGVLPSFTATQCILPVSAHEDIHINIYSNTWTSVISSTADHTSSLSSVISSIHHSSFQSYILTSWLKLKQEKVYLLVSIARSRSIPDSLVM